MKEHTLEFIIGITFTIIVNLVIIFFGFSDTLLAVFGWIFIVIAVVLGFIHRSKKKNKETINHSDDIYL